MSGGTDGIGKAYTLELAKRGLRKFVLIGRNPKKLEAVKTEIGEWELLFQIGDSMGRMGNHG